MKTGKVILSAALSCVLAGLTGCSMLPEEEEFRSAPVIREYHMREYTTLPVMRGDIELMASLYCKYEPVREEKLSFGVGGLYYDEVYVHKGDYVRKGELLAELKMGSLRDDIDNCKMEIASLELLKAQAERRLPLELERHGIYLDTLGAGPHEGVQTLDEKRAELQRGILDIEDKLYIKRLRLAELEKERDQRQLVAGMDGTVMYIRNYKDGDTSRENETVISLSDTESSMFSADTEYYSYLHPGDVFEIVCNKVSYPVKVVTPEELDIDEPAPDDGKRTVFLKLLEPAVELEAGDRGTLALKLDERSNVLYVETKAVSSAGGHSFVYYIDAEGLRRMQEVETGLQTQDFVEIVSGLEEGDEIIYS